MPERIKLTDKVLREAVPCVFRSIRLFIPIVSGHPCLAAARPEVLVISFGCFRHLL